MDARWTFALFAAAALHSPGLPGADVAPKALPAKPLEMTLVLTLKWREVFNEWDHPTGKSPNLESAAIVPRGKDVVAMVLFRNCKPDAIGNCNLELDTFAYYPDGRLYGYRADVDFWNQKPAQGPGFLQLGRRSLALSIDPGDPPGIYRVLATLRDRIGNVERTTEARFEVK
jgi:hypothetical protein